MAEMDQLLDESEYQHKFAEFISANIQATLSLEKIWLFAGECSAALFGQ